MGQVLIHLAPGGIPVGAWRVVERDGAEEVQGYYPDDYASFAGNARLALDHKGYLVPWTEWFTQLAARSPYFDDYAVTEAPDDAALADVLARFTAARTTPGGDGTS